MKDEKFPQARHKKLKKICNSLFSADSFKDKFGCRKTSNNEERCFEWKLSDKENKTINIVNWFRGTFFLTLERAQNEFKYWKDIG